MAGYGALACALAAWASSASADPPRMIDKPTWVDAGSPAADLFPAQAKAAGLATGRVMLECTATGEGHLVDCQVAGEDPPGMGFGPAALRLAPTMAIAPTD